MPNDYWIRRAALRMKHYQAMTAADRKRLARLYDAARAAMDAEAKALLERYQARYQISRADALKFLRKPVTDSEYNQLNAMLTNFHGTRDQRNLIKAQLNANSFRFRITRLEHMKRSARQVCKELAGISTEIIADSLFRTAEDSTYRVLFDMQQQAGFAWNAPAINKRRIQFLLRENWSGKHFSSRIWTNADQMAKQLSDALIVGALGGKGYSQIIEDIANITGAGYKNAERLIRTETSHIANACELEQYKEEDVQRYIYVATLDMRTSKICQELDNKIFPVADAKEGVNYPPMHPWCRSTTVADIDPEFYMQNMKRRAMDVNGQPVYVPADMDYKSWRAWHDSGYQASTWTDAHGITHDLERPVMPTFTDMPAPASPSGSALSRKIEQALTPPKDVKITGFSDPMQVNMEESLEHMRARLLHQLHPDRYPDPDAH